MFPGLNKCPDWRQKVFCFKQKSLGQSSVFIAVPFQNIQYGHKLQKHISFKPFTLKLFIFCRKTCIYTKSISISTPDIEIAGCLEIDQSRQFEFHGSQQSPERVTEVDSDYNTKTQNQQLPFHFLLGSSAGGLSYSSRLFLKRPHLILKSTPHTQQKQRPELSKQTRVS